MSEEILSDAEIDFISLPDEIIVILDTESENGKFTLSFSLML